MQKTLQNKQGSAVLISLLVMAILVVISIGLSQLVVSEIAVQADEVHRLTAYYSAESGVERGLLDIYEHNTPGYIRPSLVFGDSVVTDEKQAYVSHSLNRSDTTESQYRYQVIGQDNSVPCDFTKADGGFAVLDANQSVTIPLYRYTSDSDEPTKVSDFIVEYYVTIGDDDPLAGPLENQLTKTDVLRWKILGLHEGPQRYLFGEETDAISDYLPVKQGFNSQAQPTCFASSVDKGSQICTDPSWTKAKYYKRPVGINQYHIRDEYPISEFLDEHNYNYLMLTNVLGDKVEYSGGVFKVDRNDPAYNNLLINRKIHYRIISRDDNRLACGNYLIRSDGQFRQAEQSLDITMDLDTFLPVFDFVLYEVDQPK